MWRTSWPRVRPVAYADQREDAGADRATAPPHALEPVKAVWPLLVGLGIAGAALSLKYLLRGAPVSVPTVNGMRLTGKNFHEGGFEPKMTAREAALILNCRESASKQQVMERFRVLVKVNHPDMGGSEMLSRKVTEAKDLLLLTARDEQRK